MLRPDFKGRKALVMGLGLHGGGLETARFLIRADADVTCTDLRDENHLKQSIEALRGLDIRFVLGEHRLKDFDEADIIVKNPAVPSDSPWIAGRDNIETDISLFLKSTDAPILAVTGTKGKSTVVTALHNIVKKHHPGARLGGNITVSPLSFLEQLKPNDPVVLELSSWQLADLRGLGILRPKVACITNLMCDHQDRYENFEDYEADKLVLLENLGTGDFAVFPNGADGRKWAGNCKAEPVLVADGESAAEGQPTGYRTARLGEDGRGWLDIDGKVECILPETLRVPGKVFRQNMLFASVMARLWGCDAAAIRQAQEEFVGVSYRMEMFLEAGGIQFYDDTAATTPDAAAAAVRAMNRPVVLIAGGTDKELDFAPFESIASVPKFVVLLEGSATNAIRTILENGNAELSGPYKSMENAVEAAVSHAEPGDAVLLSPGAASFGMFRHEFERGDVFKDACRRVALF
ncbi:MAG: UDP-N-acetylmuramoyl-L-alanine--D-glutamate ligase [Spirochaetaceae bacterium]|nr:UDP-N-acetylmuramoyl-L-alanine--D-glutamate ligase [Spirochaetaceae bacterium]MDT8298744.1 UDP-N-acetylmuramoyl-L-alanine--D-glutamate ligase [Spirochaetaceae bacterium]